MRQSFIQALVESKALWLVWVAAGVVILGLCIVVASVLLSDADEPLDDGVLHRSDGARMIG